MVAELLELDNSGIHVAQYFNKYIPKKKLQEKFVTSVKSAKMQLKQRGK